MPAIGINQPNSNQTQFAPSQFSEIPFGFCPNERISSEIQQMISQVYSPEPTFVPNPEQLNTIFPNYQLHFVPSYENVYKELDQNVAQIMNRFGNHFRHYEPTSNSFYGFCS